MHTPLTHHATTTGLQPVLVHMSKNADGGYAFSPIAVNLLTELAKTAFALATLMALVRVRVATAAACMRACVFSSVSY
jgi:hypothetical protein